MDRDFIINKLIYEYLDHNGVNTLHENDNLPDFTHDRDRMGIRSVMEFSIFKSITIEIGFDFNKIAKYSKRDFERLMKDAGIGLKTKKFLINFKMMRDLKKL